MKLANHRASEGIALLIVMVAIFVLSVLIGAFAYSMKIETKLAMNANHEVELTWLGRSGVEYCRWVLSQACPSEPYDALNQPWAGGPGSGLCSNNLAIEHEVHLGPGFFKWKMVDLERKFNINIADDRILEQALTVVGVQAGEIPSISGAIIDWIDPDDQTHLNGTESDYYQGLPRPYYAKNGPIDDLSELLLIKGITQDMYWGSASTNHPPAAFQQVDRWGRPVEEPTYPVGLQELFTPLSAGKLNINTASATALQVIPFVDANTAAQIVQMRSGPDGVDGTDDDTPYRNVGEAGMAVNPQLVQQLQRYCDIRSRTYAVQVDAEIDGYRRTFYAVIGRNSPREVPILAFYWK